MAHYKAYIRESLDLSSTSNYTSSVNLSDDADLSIAGTWTGTISVQRALDGTNYTNIESYTSNTEKIISINSSGIPHRCAVTASGTGTATITIAQ